ARGRPTQRPANANGVQVDQVKDRQVALQVDEQIAGMEIAMSDAGVVDAGQQATQLRSEPVSKLGLPPWRPAPKRACKELAQRYGVIQAARDQEAVAGRSAIAAFAETQGNNGRHVAGGHG